MFSAEAVLIHEDEATFRQDPTLYQTWGRRGNQPHIPTTGQRRAMKIFGAVEIYSARFLYKFQDVFNADTYLDYLEKLLKSYFPLKIHLVQDNAPWHKNSSVWEWFSEHRKHIEVYNPPPYSPQFNALERVWHHVRMHGTHNRYFDTLSELESTLVSTFRSIQRNSSQIYGYLCPFR